LVYNKLLCAVFYYNNSILVISTLIFDGEIITQ